MKSFQFRDGGETPSLRARGKFPGTSHESRAQQESWQDFSNQINPSRVSPLNRPEGIASNSKSARRKFLKQIRPVKGYKAEQNDGWQSKRTIMKSTFEPKVSNKSNSTRQLVWLAGLVSLALSVWAAVGCLTFHHTHQTHRARSCCNWYHRSHLEFRQFVSVVNYILTPEDDVGVTAFWTGHSKPLPVLGRLMPTRVAGPGATPEASVATNRPAPPKS